LRDESGDMFLEKHTLSSVVIEEEEHENHNVEAMSRLHLPAGRRRWGNGRIAVAGFALIAALGAGYLLISGRSNRRQPISAVKSIAVLPFKALGVDSGDEYLGLGMTDTLITQLSNLSQIIVRPTSAVRKYTDPGQDPLVAGREQEVDAVLEGSIQKSGERIRVTVRLMNVRDGSSLWAYKCDDQCAGIFEMQDAISERVAAALAMTLTSEEQKRLTKRYTDNTEAYQFYLKGRYYWNKRTDESLTKGIEYFHQAIDKDPGYALAYAGIADCYNALGNSVYGGLPPRKALPQAKASAIKALEIDEALAEAHASLGFVTTQYDWEWPVAEREFKRAIELNPNYPTAHHFYAVYLAAMERLDESMREMKRAEELDPLSLIIQTDLGRRFYFARQYQQAGEQLRSVIAMDPNFFRARFDLGQVYVKQGKYEEGIAELRQAIKLSGGAAVSLARLGYAYAVSGNRDEARTLLDQLNSLAKQQYVSPYLSATIYVGLGEKDKTFQFLDAAYEERSSSLIRLKVDPIFDDLRSDSRFADLVRRVGLVNH
jgi:TolB-like protein/Flp pilus assembly protein TadD